LTSRPEKAASLISVSTKQKARAEGAQPAGPNEAMWSIYAAMVVPSGCAARPPTEAVRSIYSERSDRSVMLRAGFCMIRSSNSVLPTSGKKAQRRDRKGNPHFRSCPRMVVA